MINKSTINPQEIAKFAQHAQQWWDLQGPLKTLHDINPPRLAFIEAQMNLSKASVLDLGCGGGILSEALALKGAQVTGLDAEETAIEAAKLHASQSGLSIDYQCCPVEDYEHKGFDMISCMEMLEHVNDPQEIINHCARLLKPGGYLFLSTLNRGLKSYATAIIAAEYILGLLPKQTHDFKKFIKPSELAAMIRKAGLEFSQMKGLNYNPLSRQASLGESVDVNYLVSCFKP